MKNNCQSRSFDVIHLLCSFAALLLFITADFSSASAQSDSARIPDSTIASSVVLLRSGSSNACATGFLTRQNLLITNFHVYDSLCPAGSCSSLRVLKSQMNGAVATEKVPLPGLQLLHIFPAIDIAVFSFDGPNNTKSPFHYTERTAIGSDGVVYSAGFPGCGPLQISSGIAEKRKGFLLYSSLKGKHGSSGSPIFLSTGEVVGVIEEAESLVESLKSMALGDQFVLRGVHYQPIDKLLTTSVDQQLKMQADELLGYYLQHVLPLNEGPERLLEALQLESRLKGLEQSIHANASTDHEILLAIRNRSHYLGEILRASPKSWESSLAEQIELLTIASTIESHGIRQGIAQPLSRSVIEEVLSQKERSELFQKILGQVLDSSSSMTANGSLYYALAIGLKVLLGVAVVLTLWLISFGYVFGSYSGTFIGKIFMTGLVQIVLWPLSLLAFMLFRKK